MPGRNPEKKRYRAAPAGRGALRRELKVGAHITDETGEWEMIAPPYSTAGGRVVHARVQRINEPASWEIRSAGILGFASTEAIGRPCTSPGALPGPNPTTGVPS